MRLTSFADGALRGGVIVMLGMVAAVGISMLSDVQNLPETLDVPATSGILSAALIAIVLNLLLPADQVSAAIEEVSGGLSGKGEGQTPGH